MVAITSIASTGPHASSHCMGIEMCQSAPIGCMPLETAITAATRRMGINCMGGDDQCFESGSLCTHTLDRKDSRLSDHSQIDDHATMPVEIHVEGILIYEGEHKAVRA